MAIIRDTWQGIPVRYNTVTDELMVAGWRMLPQQLGQLTVVQGQKRKHKHLTEKAFAGERSSGVEVLCGAKVARARRVQQVFSEELESHLFDHEPTFCQPCKAAFRNRYLLGKRFSHLMTKAIAGPNNPEGFMAFFAAREG